MTPRQAFAIAGAGAAAWILIGLVFLLLFASSCAIARTPRGIALDLNDCLTDLARWPLSARCQCLRDADARCQRAGLPDRCYADGWNDADHDAFTIAACDDRRERGLEL